MKFLILKTSSFGDILQSMRALSYLRATCPYAEIHWIVEERCQELISPHPQIDKAILIDSKRGKVPKMEEYDVVFDLQGNLKSSWILMKVKAKIKFGFAFSYLVEWPNLFFTHKRILPKPGQNIRDDYLQLIQSYFKVDTPFEEEPFLYAISQEEEGFLDKINPQATLLCPFARWKNKELRLEELLKNFSPPWYFLSGTEEERGRLKKIVGEEALLPKLSLPLLQRVMDRVSLVVSADSLPLHLAATTKTPTISYFGPSLAKKYAPSGERHRSYQGICPYDMRFARRCPKLRTCPSGACMCNKK